MPAAQNILTLLTFIKYRETDRVDKVSGIETIDRINWQNNERYLLLSTSPTDALVRRCYQLLEIGHSSLMLSCLPNLVQTLIRMT